MNIAYSILYGVYYSMLDDISQTDISGGISQTKLFDGNHDLVYITN